MKRTLFALALVVATGYAYAQNEAPTYSQDQDQTYPQDEDQTYAQDEDQTLQPIIVPGVDVDRIIVECEPPNGSAQCAQFHELIRQNFTPREIGMLFGASTAYAEYRTSYDLTRDRYLAFLQNLQENGMPVPVNDHY